MPHPSARVLAQFFIDFRRYHSAAAESLRLIESQLLKGEVEPEAVADFYRQVHTLKGLSILVKGGEEIARPLQSFESLLSCRKLEDSAKIAKSWLSPAAAMLRATRRIFEKLEREHQESLRLKGGSSTTQDRGLLVRVGAAHEAGYAWFPLSHVLRVFAPDDISGREALRLDDSWIPVIGPAEHREGAYGLALSVGQGRVALRVREVVGLVSEAESAEKGATPGVRHLGALLGGDGLQPRSK